MPKRKKTPLVSQGLKTTITSIDRKNFGKSAVNTGTTKLMRDADKKENGESIVNTGITKTLRDASKQKRGESIVNTGIADLVANRKKGTTETSKRQPTAGADVGTQETDKQAQSQEVKQLSNIRRRYRRAAGRNEQLADEAEQAGDTHRAEALRSAATAAREYASSLTVRNITDSSMTPEQRHSAISRTVYEEAERSLYQNAAFNNDFDEYSNNLASTILSNGRGGQFYAATRDLWIGTNGEDRNDAIVQSFQDAGYDVTNILDVMRILQAETGVKYLSPTSEQQAKQDYLNETAKSTKVVRRVKRRGKRNAKKAA